MKSIFLPPTPFLLPLLSIFIGVVWACYEIVIKNLSSKDIAFSFAALAAAFVMFYLNICLSLEEKKREESIKMHMVIGRDCVIDVFSTGTNKANFIVFNREALSLACIQTLSKYSDGNKVQIPERTPEKQNDDALTASTRFFLFNSLFGHWLESYPDWRMETKSFKGAYYTSYRNSKESRGNDSFISKEEINETIGNFAKGFSLSNSIMMGNGLTLPPETSLTMEGDRIVLDNPFVRIEFSVDVSNIMTVAYPQTGNDGRTILYVGHENSALNYDANIGILITMKRERRGSVDYNTYDEWANKLVDFLKKGFE
ncbi:hypothetical protein KW841_07840 [Pseudomonas sp. PDM28]|uniref:hypothetical protein n=1 Tax=Pseudomonas sp. PDM28 TaxID=2854770 RepID=UPI001C489385|nr:hypothetical protein [Pseudomonas sp. PDM28]MBV7552254.1 hypothetical protein [Pseudomonas sp. PDM28]